ncbi:MAG: site-specific DNA-methyltransferase, partial [Candidatus Methylarchaceae archaeon HK02M2]|nr:site-specific DNA-methyltransferase [Candidatus Methylarchaceae archaeon HK02M2]
MKIRRIVPISKTIPPKRQAAKRHYGVHPYFTRRPWNVVQEYIKNFTTNGEVVLDPFGGSGITAIESLVLDRKAIQVDICPLANFLTEQVAIAPVDLNKLSDSFHHIAKKCRNKILNLYKMQETETLKIEIPFWYPRGIRLPK